MRAIEAAPSMERERLGRDLYLRFSQFVATDRVDMADEEKVVLPMMGGPSAGSTRSVVQASGSGPFALRARA